MPSKANTREVILDILMRITGDGVYSNVAIRDALNEQILYTRQESAFVKTVAEGVIERMIELDYIIDAYASVGTADMKPVIRNILRSAVYQMRFMDSVPVSAACDEAVKLAQKKGFYNLKGFVNGVLRAIARDPEAVEYPHSSNRMEYLSVKYSMPRWIVKMWADEYADAGELFDQTAAYGPVPHESRSADGGAYLIEAAGGRGHACAVPSLRVSFVQCS